MKQIIVLFLFTTLLASCGYVNSKREARIAREDSLQHIRQQRDSLIKAEESKVFADIYFGISEEEYQKKNDIIQF